MNFRYISPVQPKPTNKQCTLETVLPVVAHFRLLLALAIVRVVVDFIRFFTTN